MKKRPSIVASLLLLLVLVPLVSFGARVVTLPVLPGGELPNSEAVTNVTLNVDYARLESLTFSLELNASASNSLSIAVGTAEGDSLSFEDADFEWGYDCGKWFCADTETGKIDFVVGLCRSVRSVAACPVLA